MTFTRRTFMETTCALSAGLVFGSLAHASTKVPEKWDETCSLLIIGTGFAGLGAALESHYLGMKDILVVDKMPSAGGNSIINGGAIAAAGTDMQEKAGWKRKMQNGCFTGISSNLRIPWRVFRARWYPEQSP